MSRCDCCERTVSKVRGSPWHGNAKICLACFYVWYDGPCDSGDPAQIAAEVLEAERIGAYPFTMSNRADFERRSTP